MELIRKLNSLYICSYDARNINNCQFVKTMNEDSLVREYVSIRVGNRIMASFNDEKILLEHGYIIADENNLIGFFSSFLDFNQLELEYGVHPKFRNQGFGSKILCEVSDYFLTERDFVEKIVLNIDSNNIYSEKAAIHAMFKKEQENKFTKFYTKTLKK